MPRRVIPVLAGLVAGVLFLTANIAALHASARAGRASRSTAPGPASTS